MARLVEISRACGCAERLLSCTQWSLRTPEVIDCHRLHPTANPLRFIAAGELGL